MRPPDDRTVGRSVGAAMLVMAGMVLGPRERLAAQDSQYQIQGLGTPGRWESVQARSTGGAFGPFDPLSPLTEAPIMNLGRLTATAMSATYHRDVEIDGTTAALRDTRFPLMSLATPIGSRLAVAIGFSTYLDKSWDVVLRDSAVVRGELERYTDETVSDGSVADVRFAVAARLGKRVSIGGAVHLLAGSTRETAVRRWDDSTFHAVLQLASVTYDGYGASASVLIALAPGLSLSGWARSDDQLTSKAANRTTAVRNLPRMAGGGVFLSPSRSVRLAASAAWRSWSDAGPGAFDTWSWSAGGEFGRSTPFRLGVRGGQMPFGPGTTAPTEFAIAGGTGRALAQGRAFVDLGIERLQRQGGGLTERVWTVMVGLTVRP